MVCEQIIIDRESNNVSLINCFTTKRLERFPSEPQRFALVAFLVGYVGNLQVDVVIRRLDTLDDLFRRRVVLRFADRLEAIRLLVRLRCSFPEAGAYEAALETNGEILAQRRIQLT